MVFIKKHIYFFENTHSNYSKGIFHRESKDTFDITKHTFQITKDTFRKHTLGPQTDILLFCEKTYLLFENTNMYFILYYEYYARNIFLQKHQSL